MAITNYTQGFPQVEAIQFTGTLESVVAIQEFVDEGSTELIRCVCNETIEDVAVLVTWPDRTVHSVIVGNWLVKGDAGWGVFSNVEFEKRFCHLVSIYAYRNSIIDKRLTGENQCK